MQNAPRRNWTRAKEFEFLSTLAETCNVTRAAEAAGMSARGAYKRRKRNAAFRTAWLGAIGAAYQQLELVLLDRFFNGTERVIRRRDGGEERMREFPNQLGLSLLKMHRATATEVIEQAAMSVEDVDALRERLLRKVERLEMRRRGE